MTAPFLSNCSVCHDVGVYYGYGYGEGGERYMYRCSEEGCPAYIRSCQEEDEVIAERRARSTLTLLSRFAVFMWLEASVQPDERGWCRLRSDMFEAAVLGGLLRVTWRTP